MTNVIREIVLLAGGVDRFNSIEVTPPGQPPLVIAREGLQLLVVLGGRLTMYVFSIGTIEGRFDLRPMIPWPESLDREMRKRGYIEAAIHFRLSQLG